MKHCSLTPRNERELSSVYTELHEGLKPSKFACVPTPARAKQARVFGRMTEIQYRKNTTENVGRTGPIDLDAPHYHHPFAVGAQPKIAVDENRGLRIFRGRYVVTTHGIEDLPESSIRGESLPSDPNYLVDLGKLEWIKYKTDDGKENEIRFPQHTPPTLSHDERGDLHLLGGRYAIQVPTGEGKTMKYSRRRHNPATKREKGDVQRMIMGSLVLGAVATVTIVVFDAAIDRFWPAWSLQAKAATKVGLGLLGAYAIGMAGGRKAAPIAAGVGAGGVIDGMKSLYDLYIAPMMLQATTTTTAPPATGTGTGTGSAGVLLPAGLPRNYVPATRQSCAA